jgi:hypothetical protein
MYHKNMVAPHHARTDVHSEDSGEKKREKY